MEGVGGSGREGGRVLASCPHSPSQEVRTVCSCAAETATLC